MFKMTMAFLALAFYAMPAASEEVKTELEGLDLMGELVLSPGKTLERHGVVLLLHDVAMSKVEEPVVSLRDGLVAQGFNVLAINLSLGLDHRSGRYDCRVEQDHLYTDALPEIHAWVKWLQGKGARNIALLGIGRGAGQIALYGSKTTQRAVRSIILLAPVELVQSQLEKDYQILHGKSLEGVLFEAQALIASQQAGALLDKTGFLNCPAANVSARSFVSYYQQRPEFALSTLVGLIKKPTLVIAPELGRNSQSLLAALQQVEARPTLRLDVIEAADDQFSDGAMTQVVERIKLFGQDMKRK